MKFVGLALIFVCTFGGLLIAMHFDFGHFTHLLLMILGAMPGEFVIIFGCAVAAFLTANSMEVIKGTMKYFSALAKPSAYNKADYVELLSFMFTCFKLARSKGWLAMESHIENPHDSEMFNRFPKVAHDHHVITFFCDYFRLISLGNDNPHEIGDLMDEELEGINHHEHHAGHAVQTMADGIPALGIVAAVLGVIKTMASISEPPEILGKMIGGALVGTFLGVWIAYGMVAPIAGAMTAKADTKVMYYRCIKVGILSFLNGSAPQIAVEFARKMLPHDVQPSFQELEEHLNSLPPP
ncbi:MAG: flagellar motor stator protein MotA [Rhodospirillales bacterium]|nr:flagellar motor stator protein MotA [Rhodospirillales bacterium]MCB9964997.1 flagellar motor stator protein MotA [Rhodospirillales bacterium]MCB9973411.1 flagellar motor stator protein MotA [Rhodospirillales bacterium]MCB9980414.1 flagellar motor stator protein MotA [Rhodospirillales bacterium]